MSQSDVGGNDFMTTLMAEIQRAGRYGRMTLILGRTEKDFQVVKFIDLTSLEAFKDSYYISVFPTSWCRYLKCETADATSFKLIAVLRV